MDKILKTVTDLDMSDMVLPIITLYKKPYDYPEHYVARVWECAPPKGMKGPLPTNTVILYDTLSQAEKDLRPFTRMERNENDDPKIVATFFP